jgi:OmpA-OmpF porin, OOP family
MPPTKRRTSRSDRPRRSWGKSAQAFVRLTPRNWRRTATDSAWQSVLEVTNIAGQVYYVNKFGVYSGGDWNAQPGKPRSSSSPCAGPSAPPPPAPTAPEAQREFQVFFDFDKSDITDAAAKVIQAAADVVKAGGVAHITVTGHTDTVGAAAYNQALSERRAASVKHQLTSDGVDGGEISTVGVGKTGLLVPTADGVREPQNRRAVIQLQ